MSDATADELDNLDVPDDVMEKVTAYVDGTLSEPEASEVATRLASTRADERVWRAAHEEVVIIKVTDYVEGNLPAEAKATIEAKIASDELWRRIHAEMTDARDVISGIRLPTSEAPKEFVDHVTETIHKRSAGGFFARRTLGDRVPFGVLLIVALLALGVVGYLMWSSPTGSLKVPVEREVPKHEPLGIEHP